VLSVGAVARYVQRGITLSFDLVDGKPKLLLGLGAANKQGVSLSGNVLTLMTVQK